MSFFYRCDRCRAEIGGFCNTIKFPASRMMMPGEPIPMMPRFADLCDPCYKELETWIKKEPTR